MSTEKEWFVKEYAQDIHNYLRAKERKRFLYCERSPQLSMRKSLVEWMVIVCEKMDFCTTVQHLAVYLLDIFLDNHTVSANHLQLATVGCLIVAVKLEENDSLPKNSDFNALTGNKYKLKEFLQMELTVLNFFKWDILFPTAAHFAEYYGIYSVSSTDNYDGGPLLNIEHVKLYVQKYTDYFLEATLQDTVFHKFYPSLVAAACILSTRMCLVLTPPWPVSLQNITSYKYAQLKPCVEILLRFNYKGKKRFLALEEATILLNKLDCDASDDPIDEDGKNENIDVVIIPPKVDDWTDEGELQVNAKTSLPKDVAELLMLMY